MAGEAYRGLKHLTNNIVCNHRNSTTWTSEISFVFVNIRAESPYNNDYEIYPADVKIEALIYSVYFCLNKYVLLLNYTFCWNLKPHEIYWNQILVAWFCYSMSATKPSLYQNCLL